MHSANAAFSSRSSNMSQGCPVPVGNSVCGETNSLEIMKEFNRLYEERMDQVDCEAGGDYLQEKLKLQQEWIKNLTQQNEMLVRAVQELEYEATERVQQLEDKLQKSAQCLCEGEKMLIEKERTVEELTQKLNHYSSYGDVEGMARELEIRRQETESLKQELADVRQVLTEEVASKHDQIVQLKKDILVFEERCLQADKQTAFKEDIVKELRKEIKQLKQQFTQDEISKLNATIGELKDHLERTKLAQDEEEKVHQKEISQLNETIDNLELELRAMVEKYEKDSKTCKICKGRSKIGFLENSEVQVDLESREEDNLTKALTETRSKMRLEIDKRNNEIQMLKNKVSELEASLISCEERAANLQDAVNLYSNSVNVLETSNEEAKLQITQQKVTISNLQEALVEAKNEVDELRKKSQDNVSGANSWSAWFGLSPITDVPSNNNNQNRAITLSNKPVHDI